MRRRNPTASSRNPRPLRFENLFGEGSVPTNPIRFPDAWRRLLELNWTEAASRSPTPIRFRDACLAWPSEVLEVPGGPSTIESVFSGSGPGAPQERSWRIWRGFGRGVVACDRSDRMVAGNRVMGLEALIRTGAESHSF
jgi:hypothetical protein